MKKMFAFLLLIILLTTSNHSAFAAETHVGYLLNILESTAAEWASTSNNRALFTSCAILDLMIVTEDAEDERISEIAAYASINDGIAFIRSSSIIAAIFCGEEDVLMIAYQPSSNEFNHT